VAVFPLQKFCSYLINSEVIIFTNDAALEHLIKKSDFKSYVIQWVLVLQEFDLEIPKNGTLEVEFF